MLRVLHIARYAHRAAWKKLDILGSLGGWQVHHLYPHTPAHPQPPAGVRFTHAAVPMLGAVTDPHYAVYRTVTFHLRRWQPAIIHAEEEPDSLAALHIALARALFAPKARLLWHTWQNLDRPTRPAVRWVRRTTLNAAHGVLTANQAALNLLARWGFKGLAALVPQNGVDEDVFHPRPRPATAVFRVGYAGRLAPEKGLDTLCQAFDALSAQASAELHVVGAGPLLADLQHWQTASPFGARWTLHPPCPPEQLAELMSQWDVLVLPSRRTPVWEEQFGRVLIEAMACGVPVLGTATGAIPEVIGEAGLTFPENDVSALSAALLTLCRQPEQRQALAANALRRARTVYSQTVIAHSTAEFYERLLSA